LEYKGIGLLGGELWQNSQTMCAAELIRRLERAGWVLKNQKGSHKHFVHPRRRDKLTVPDHGKQDVPMAAEL
jgi:predicted RNA binding protein YcfA (HicA-like mRNA interferase family)